MTTVVRALEDVLQQGLSLLDELDVQTYSRVVSGPYNASIGQHYRHVLDHFLCLDEGVRSGNIDYDRRAREPRLETDINFARVVTERLIQTFGKYPTPLLHQVCTVCYSVGSGNAAPVRLNSAVARELAFCIGHAVHHFAIIRLLCESIGAHLLPDFGVAPSTLKHRAEQLAS